MKLRNVVLIILLIILGDQAIKIWIKTSYATGDTGLSNLSWFRLHFIENPGMAWGWKFGNETGKVILTVFRLIAVIVGSFYLVKWSKQAYTKGFMVCAALIYAGALGNLIDSLFYGVLFDKGLHFDPQIKDYIGYSGIADFTKGEGYAPLFHGSVVDMLHFPIIDSHFPSWVPFVGGDKFEFFSPIFNIADASISAGVITLLIFQKRFFKKIPSSSTAVPVETNTRTTDQSQVL